jgi:hypothetical protein
MRQPGRNQGFELGDEQVHPFRGEVELEHLDRHQTTAVGIGCTKDRAQRSRADLMKDAERAERVRRRGAGGFRMQWDNSCGRRTDRSTTIRGCE